MPAIKHKDLLLSVQEWSGRDHGGEGDSLASMLGCAVPLWMFIYRQQGPEARQRELERLNDPENDFYLRLEYVLHKGPKPGDTAKAFNDLAKAIALLSFCPGGVCVFGQRFQWRDSAGKEV